MPEKAIDLDPAAALPDTDPAFCQAASDIALLAGGLMMSTDSPLLAIAVPSDGWGGAMPMMLWNQRLAPCAERGAALIENEMFGPAVDALCLAADALFERLEAWRWTHADAPGLCVVTDGTGVLLTRQAPGGVNDAGWLLDIASPDGGAIPLLRMADDGVWPLIASESATMH